MPEVYLASSALKKEGYEAGATIDAGVFSRFEGVQLFLDPRFRDPIYCAQIIQKLKDTPLGLVLHLPDIPTREDVRAAEKFVRHIPGGKVLIHYLPQTALPVLKGTRVGWENSKIGPMGSEMESYMAEVAHRVKEDNTFLVFDMGRLLYGNGDEQVRKATAYIKKKIASLDPGHDIIHLADKTSWTMKFRDCMCVLGEGVMAGFIAELRQFPGTIVFEHEDLQMAINSLKVFKRT